MTKIFRSAALWLVIALALMSIYWKLIIFDPILQRDDQHILDTLKYRNPNSWNDLLVHGVIRDLTLQLDLFFRRELHLSTFHFTNLLIWGVIVGCVYKILGMVLEEIKDWRPGLIVLFALNPCFVNSVGWVAARKHLLAAAFILLATLFFLDLLKKQNRVAARLSLIFVFYFCSLLSHPIGLAWPIWAAFEAWRQKFENKTFYMFFILFGYVMEVSAVANWTYFSTDYQFYTLVSKQVSDLLLPDRIVIGLLSLGRSIFNLLVPFRLAVTYNPASYFNLFGVSLVLLIVFGLFRNRKDSRIWVWLLFFLVPLFPVTFTITNIFVSDTYVLCGAAGLLIAVTLILKPWLIKVGVHRLRLATGVLAFIFWQASMVQAQSWVSDRILWTRSYEIEPTPRALSIKIRFLIDDQHFEEAQKAAQILKEWDPQSPDFDLLFSKAVYLNPKLTLDEKHKLISMEKSTTWTDYYLAAVQYAQGKYQDARESCKRSLDYPSRFGSELPMVLAECVFYCQKSGTPCQDLAAETIDQCRKGAYSQFCIWDEEKFKETLSSHFK